MIIRWTTILVPYLYSSNSNGCQATYPIIANPAHKHDYFQLDMIDMENLCKVSDLYQRKRQIFLRILTETVVTGMLANCSMAHLHDTDFCVTLTSMWPCSHSPSGRRVAGRWHATVHHPHRFHHWSPDACFQRCSHLILRTTSQLRLWCRKTWVLSKIG